MLRLLHTADWHIGKQLYKHPLYDDITLFLDELKTILIEESIDILLIAGDIFDLANPSKGTKRYIMDFLPKFNP